MELAVYARDPDHAGQALAGVNPDAFPPMPPRAYWQGVIARLRKDDAAAQRAYGEARAEVAKALQARPEDPELMGALGLIAANAGEKEEALRLGRGAVELLPVERDSMKGMKLAVNLACIQGWIGEKDQAIAELTRLVKNPTIPPYGNLRCLPQYECLRGDPRFEAIVASHAPKS